MKNRIFITTADSGPRTAYITESDFTVLEELIRRTDQYDCLSITGGGGAITATFGIIEHCYYENKSVRLQSLCSAGLLFLCAKLKIDSDPAVAWTHLVWDSEKTETDFSHRWKLTTDMLAAAGQYPFFKQKALRLYKQMFANQFKRDGMVGWLSFYLKRDEIMALVLATDEEQGTQDDRHSSKLDADNGGVIRALARAGDKEAQARWVEKEIEILRLSATATDKSFKFLDVLSLCILFDNGGDIKHLIRNIPGTRRLTTDQIKSWYSLWAEQRASRGLLEVKLEDILDTTKTYFRMSEVSGPINATEGNK